nr:hypothetical protein [Rhodospirillales bacterium]
MNQINRQREIIDRLSIDEQLHSVMGDDAYNSSKRQEILSVLKSALMMGKAEVQNRFEIGGANTYFGGQVMRGNTFLIDQLVRIIFDV